MKTKEKIMPILMLAMVLGLVGCGNSVPAINDSVVVNVTEESTAAEKVIPDGEIPATVKPAERGTNPMAEPTTKTTEPEPTVPPHVHDFKVESSTEATCAESGEKKLVCECGESQIEPVPATGNHNWKEVTTVINHPELGHVEQVQVGTTEGYTIYECAACGYQDTSPLSDHRAAYVGIDRNHAFARTIMYDYPGEPIFEPQWVVDQNAWEETVVTGYTCTVCGATK